MKLEVLFDQLHTLPTVPKVAQDLIRQFDDPTTNIDVLAHTIERDPVIAAKVLRLANSARFHGLRDSTSVEDAAMRLGFNTLRTLVLASAMTGAFRAGPGFDLNTFWRYSFGVAGICRLLARQHGLDPETAFTCGMMHNIGELLIQSGAPEYASRINHEASSAGHAAEETLQLGFGYPEVGAELARRWHLPVVIQQAIAYQVRPAAAPEGALMPLLLAQAVQVSDALRIHDGAIPAALEAVRGPLMDSVDLDALFAALPDVIEADRAFAELLH
ncbi:HDOD domain-containing protein [Xanthomonas hortorum pv. vitians]|uniref:HDOD domain-containing protein n=2 Tax=Xanthomonas hortorum TaxID=56454 RepID=A0A6V7D7C2_9XANT|nr:HDOD domain-containing protein [Xanthomonas hortorum]MCC4624608.1 HDOD domain-containing protein [Xanthomonas campestris pv. nigromaculans]APP79847.1 histidine kinase [Xanthomonas hortorum pv. gardneri]APP83977.1 histidine kinase [Xanthomonas hortorum pv. gardneri]ASW46104.1 histidine kinase [Xanthomonas hortorum]EGD18846.1 putative signal transduction protein [Xanthomonas hortorum ATCC 19865]